MPVPFHITSDHDNLLGPVVGWPVDVSLSRPKANLDVPFPGKSGLQGNYADQYFVASSAESISVAVKSSQNSVLILMWAGADLS